MSSLGRSVVETINAGGAANDSSSDHIETVSESVILESGVTLRRLLEILDRP